MNRYMTFEAVIKDKKDGKVLYREEIGLCQDCCEAVTTNRGRNKTLKQREAKNLLQQENEKRATGKRSV